MAEGTWISDRKMERIGNHYIKWLKTQSRNHAKCYNRKLEFRSYLRYPRFDSFCSYATNLSLFYCCYMTFFSFIADDFWTADSFLKQTVFFYVGTESVSAA